MKSNINKKLLITINAVNILMLIGIIIVKFLLNQYVFYAIFVVWIMFVAYSNYNVLVQNTDIAGIIKSADKQGVFKSETELLLQAHKSVVMREACFSHLQDGDILKEAYEQISKQIYSNIKSAVQYMKTYDYVMRPSYFYLTNLCDNTKTLLAKMSELVELSIRMESTADDVDMSVVNNILESLRSVIDEQQEQ